MMKRIVSVAAFGAFLLACSNDQKGFSSKASTNQMKKAEDYSGEKEVAETPLAAPAPAPAPEPVKEEMPEVLPEAETTALDPRIPANAVKALKVGVNFEDIPDSDADYNDAVMCFIGGFAVTDSEIVSLQDQNISADMFSNAGYNNILVVEILRDGVSVHKSEYNPKTQTKIASIDFKKGDRLVAAIKSQGVGQAHPMTEAAWAQFKPDLCNDK